MIKLSWRIGIVAVLSLVTALVEAQQSDFQVRAGLQLSGNLSLKTKWDIETESRFVENANQFERIQIQPSISYRINNLMSVAVGYRFATFFHENENTEFQSRLNADFSLVKKINSFEFKLRSRCYYDLNDYLLNNQFIVGDLLYRHAFTAEYNIWGSRWTPSVSFELFHSLNRMDIRNIRQLRYTGSIDYRLNRKTTLSAYYFIDKIVNKSYPASNFIFGTNLKYKF